MSQPKPHPSIADWVLNLVVLAVILPVPGLPVAACCGVRVPWECFPASGGLALWAMRFAFNMPFFPPGFWEWFKKR